MQARIQLVTDIMGTKVKTPEGEEVGVVQNIMVDPNNGTIIYLVLCYANFIGKMNRQFAIPRQMLNLKQIDGISFLEIDENKLHNVPGLTPESWTPHSFDKDPQSIYEMLPGGRKSAAEFMN